MVNIVAACQGGFLYIVKSSRKAQGNTQTSAAMVRESDESRPKMKIKTVDHGISETGCPRKDG